MIIFLNGTSSAGKSSTAKKIQELCTEPVLHMGIDSFFFSLDPRYVGVGREAHLGYQFVEQANPSGPTTIVKKGKLGRELSQALHRALRAIADRDIHLVIDDLLFEEEDFQDYLEVFADKEVYFIAIKPSLEVVEAREKERGDRMQGLARGLYADVYENKIFDLEIDVSMISPETAARRVLDFIEAHPKPTAFQQNAHRFSTVTMSDT